MSEKLEAEQMPVDALASGGGARELGVSVDGTSEEMETSFGLQTRTATLVSSPVGNGSRAIITQQGRRHERERAGDIQKRKDPSWQVRTPGSRS
jgi:hypothetical protein